MPIMIADWEPDMTQTMTVHLASGKVYRVVSYVQHGDKFKLELEEVINV